MVAGREVRLLLFYDLSDALPQTLRIKGRNVPVAYGKAIFTHWLLLKHYVKTAINYRVYTGTRDVFSIYFYGMIFN